MFLDFGLTFFVFLRVVLKLSLQILRCFFVCLWMRVDFRFQEFYFPKELFVFLYLLLKLLGLCLRVIKSALLRSEVQVSALSKPVSRRIKMTLAPVYLVLVTSYLSHWVHQRVASMPIVTSKLILSIVITINGNRYIASAPIRRLLLHWMVIHVFRQLLVHLIYWRVLVLATAVDLLYHFIIWVLLLDSVILVCIKLIIRTCNHTWEKSTMSILVILLFLQLLFQFLDS